MGLPRWLPDACSGVLWACADAKAAGLVTLVRKKGLRTPLVFASAFVLLGVTTGSTWIRQVSLHRSPSHNF